MIPLEVMKLLGISGNFSLEFLKMRFFLEFLKFMITEDFV